MKPLFLTALVIAVVLGLSIAYIDTRPHWNNTGISVGTILIASFIGGVISPRKTWLIALIPAFIGAYAGWFFRHLLVSTGSKSRL